MNTSRNPEPDFNAEWEVDPWDNKGSVTINAEDVGDFQNVEDALEYVDAHIRRDFEQAVRWFRANNEELKTWISECIEARKEREAAEETEDEE